MRQARPRRGVASDFFWPTRVTPSQPRDGVTVSVPGRARPLPAPHGSSTARDRGCPRCERSPFNTPAGPAGWLLRADLAAAFLGLDPDNFDRPRRDDVGASFLDDGPKGLLRRPAVPETRRGSCPSRAWGSPARSVRRGSPSPGPGIRCAGPPASVPSAMRPAARVVRPDPRRSPPMAPPIPASAMRPSPPWGSPRSSGGPSTGRPTSSLPPRKNARTLNHLGNRAAVKGSFFRFLRPMPQNGISSSRSLRRPPPEGALPREPPKLS